MLKRLTWPVSLLCALLVACTPATAPSPTAVPAAKPTEAAAKPTQAAAKPAATDAEWDRILAAAKQEGKVMVVGTTTDRLIGAVTTAFQAKYGIPVEYVGPSSREKVPQIQTERQANQFNWDVWVDGTTTALTGLLPMNALDPLPSALLLDEVKDPRAWRGGAGPEYLDDEKRVLVMTPFQRGTVFYNPTLAKPEEFKSYKDLLDPKWKGKLLIDDPRNAGPGQATFTFFFLHPELGPEFIRALGKQEPQITRDWAQQVDMVGQGRVPVLVGGVDAIVEQRMRQGVPIAIVDPRGIKEGSDISPANGALGMFNRAPHPNAAKVFVNWLLSKEGQTVFAQAQGYVSSREDVPLPEGAAPWRVPVPGGIKTYTRQAVDGKDAMLAVAQEAFGGR
jgi:iron(III) transport system substrate-binding protein